MKHIIGFALAGILVLFALTACLDYVRGASEIRLIGECDGKFYGAMAESDFPAGCAWIEPIRFDAE